MADITVNLQVGLHREALTLDLTNLTLINIKRIVTGHIDQKFAEHRVSRLVDRLVLFRHDYSSPNILQLLTSATDLYDGCILEGVVSRQPVEDKEIRPHILVIHSYKTPTFCDYCGEMLFGMFKQVETEVREEMSDGLLLAGVEM